MLLTKACLHCSLFSDWEPEHHWRTQSKSPYTTQASFSSPFVPWGYSPSWYSSDDILKQGIEMGSERALNLAFFLALSQHFKETMPFRPYQHDLQNQRLVFFKLQTHTLVGVLPAMIWHPKARQNVILNFLGFLKYKMIANLYSCSANIGFCLFVCSLLFCFPQITFKNGIIAICDQILRIHVCLSGNFVTLFSNVIYNFANLQQTAVTILDLRN